MRNATTSALVFLLSLVGMAPAACHAQSVPMQISGRAESVPPSYFGMHIHRALTTTSWPSVQFGEIRLWDTGTTWRDLEPRRGEWHFDNLDRLVSLSREHQVDVLLTFGKTPSWASAPDAATTKHPEAAPPVDMAVWREFVQAIATRYKGRIRAYEVWNEPNLPEYFTGSVPTMVEMTQEAAQIIHAIDPNALVVSPSATTANGLPWLREFIRDGGGHYVDVIGYHFYVTPDPPEKMPDLISKVKSILADYHQKQPIWNTETGWSSPRQFASPTEAGAYLARAELLAWTSGVSRFYWYAWDNDNWVTLRLTTPGTPRPATEAVTTYSVVERWITGARVDLCSSDRNGVWTCLLHSPGGKLQRLVWSTGTPLAYSISAHRINPVHEVTRANGSTEKINGDVVMIDAQPSLIQ